MNALYKGEITIANDERVNKAKRILKEYQAVLHYEISDDSAHSDKIIYTCPNSYPLGVLPVLKELAQKMQENKIQFEIRFSYTGFGNSSEKIFYNQFTRSFACTTGEAVENLT